MHGPLAQLGERQVRNLEVRGSIPLWSTIPSKGASTVPFPLYSENCTMFAPSSF